MYTCSFLTRYCTRACNPYTSAPSFQTYCFAAVWRPTDAVLLFYDDNDDMLDVSFPTSWSELAVSMCNEHRCAVTWQDNPAVTHVHYMQGKLIDRTTAHPCTCTRFFFSCFYASASYCHQSLPAYVYSNGASYLNTFDRTTVEHDLNSIQLKLRRSHVTAFSADISARNCAILLKFGSKYVFFVWFQRGMTDATSGVLQVAMHRNRHLF